MFTYHSATRGVDQQMRRKNGAIANGVSLAPGQVCKLVNGRWDAAASGDTIDAVMGGHLTLVGNAAGSVIGEFVPVRGNEFAVGQNSIGASSCEPGDYLDIDATGLLPASPAVNNDLRVTRRDVARAILYVEFVDNTGV